MGAAGSVRRTAPSSLQAEIERLRERELDLMEEHEKQQSAAVLKHEARIIQLEAERHELAAHLKETTTLLSKHSEGWKKEQAKTLSLMFSDLPLTLLKSESAELANIESNSLMTRSFPMVTIAQCDIVGFSALSAKLPAQQVVTIIDRLHTVIDEAFADLDIFVMERTSDGCIAVSGLVEFTKDEQSQRLDTFTPLSMTDSSYGSEVHLDHGCQTNARLEELPAKLPNETAGENLRVKPNKTPSYYAGVLSTAALKLMSFSSKISVPLSDSQQLQLRIAIHSGPCSAGVVGLQTSTGTSRVPHYKVFGPTVRYLRSLCSSGLALQVRVSKHCRDLLVEAGGYMFERCPDYMAWSNLKPIESYWLVAKEDMPLRLPSVNEAISLWDYEDIEF